MEVSGECCAVGLGALRRLRVYVPHRWAFNSFRVSYGIVIKGFSYSLALSLRFVV